MTFSFRPAVRENVGLWINMVGGTGSGKTFSAMRLASGMAGGKPFALIDTENRRGLHYADAFKFDHGDLRAPFTPDAYSEAITAADKAGYPVIVVDSGSHCWSGDGGMLDWQEAELDRMAGQDWAKRERVKMSAWIKPKGSHKKMVSKLLALRAHLIFCLRAEPKIEMVKNAQGKLEIQAKHSLTGLDGWIPICDKNLPFEATASFLLMADNPGVPRPIKLQDQHKRIFMIGNLDDKAYGIIDENCGRRLSEWASGATPSPAAPPSQARDAAGAPPSDQPAGAADFITPDQCANLETLAQDGGVPLENLRKAAKVDRLAVILAADYSRALDWLNAAVAKRRPQQTTEVKP